MKKCSRNPRNATFNTCNADKTSKGKAVMMSISGNVSIEICFPQRLQVLLCRPNDLGLADKLEDKPAGLEYDNQRREYGGENA
jgi:hypothetical protein